MNAQSANDVDSRTAGDDELTVHIAPELGGRISRIRFRGIDLLQPRPPVATRFGDFGWGSFVMAPWCNRLPAGPLLGFEREGYLTTNCDDGTAIHGLVHDIPWRRVTDSRLDATIEPGNFPWRFRMQSAIDVAGSTLTYQLSLQNADDAAMPAGLGWHPWFNATNSDLALSVNAKREYDFDEGYIPEDYPHLQVDAEHRVSSLHTPQWGSHKLYTALGSHTIPLLWAESGVSAVLSFEGPVDHVLVYAAEELHAIAIEPQTHAPDGIRRLREHLPGALTLLEPGEQLDVTYRLQVRAASRDRVPAIPLERSRPGLDFDRLQAMRPTLGIEEISSPV